MLHYFADDKKPVKKSQSVNKSKKIQLRNLPAKKEKEHCGRQIPTDKYNKNTTLMFFFPSK